MKNTLMKYLHIIEEQAAEVLQGKGADIDVINDAIHQSAGIILDVAEQLPDEDKLTTINYIKTGLNNYRNAIDNRDDFLLADCLYYEWREIIAIYIDALGE